MSTAERPRRPARAVVVLFVIAALSGGGNLWWTAHEVDANNGKFCGVVGAVTAVRVPRPADPAANPSRENQYEWYERFVSLSSSLGCRR